MTCGERWPFSSWATVSAAITANCFCPGGYLAIAWSIFFSASALNTSAHLFENRGQTTFLLAILTARRRERKNVVCPRFSSVDLAEDDVLSPDDRDDIGQ